ncbi:THO complex subunit 1 [Anopheles ziemanni]|uniref:THO complex subunit 1 n=1 Tax=Anopheles coustani TaxID=139045 RepID=UPI0026587823|nr:THO complex subunit 1 [Anopheles coustani]XP_058171496.1 THO complex subunit 1 [Anopheles ziemanni]
MSSSNFLVLLKAFSESLKRAFKEDDIELLKAEYDAARASDNDKKTALHQAFRDMLLTKTEDIPAIERFISFAVTSCRKDMTVATMPVVLLGDIFDAVTLDRAEKIFTYVENNVAIWKEEFFFTACKHNLLRMCNDLLRRLSRSQNTVFCGRILLFLAKFFPFSERSGLNIISEFNLENITEYGMEGNEMTLEQLSAGSEVEDDAKTEDEKLKIDYNLYCKFWALQDFFRNPNQCYNKVQWKTFATHAGSVLAAFISFKLEEHRASSVSTKAPEGSAATDDRMEEDQIRESGHFFAKFLTNPKLLSLQLSDSNFRRSVLVQFLILFQYLNSTVKFKAETHILTQAQSDWLKETETVVYRLIEESPPNGKKFATTVRHMLTREELWNSWKNEGCKEFKRPEAVLEEGSSTTATTSSGSGAAPAVTASSGRPPAKRPRRPLGDLIRDATKQGKFYMGNQEITRLWNLCPDNLQACKGTDRNFLPSLESYLENPKEKQDPSFEWRALRLLARQSPHFFTLFNTPSYKVSDYLESVRKKIQKDKLDIKLENAIKEETAPQSTEQTEAEGEGLVGDEEHEQMETELLKTEQLTPEDKNTHKTLAVSKEQLSELAPSIGKDWKKLATKLGYSADEIQYFESENATVVDQCCHLLTLWFDDDMDASLDNLAYILEGLEMMPAADAVKQMIALLSDKAEDVSE